MVVPFGNIECVLMSGSLERKSWTVAVRDAEETFLQALEREIARLATRMKRPGVLTSC